MKLKHVIIPIFVPHLGCPNDCIFCNQVKIANASTDITVDDVRNTVESHLKTIDLDNTLVEISFFGGTFTGIDPQIQKSFLQIAKTYKDRGLVQKIRLSTRPDCIDREILDYLKAYGVDIIELGVQSLDDAVLKANRRGHSCEDVRQATRLIRDYTFELGLQIMPGLYQSSHEIDLQTVNQVIALSPDFVRVYPTLVVKNTYLEQLYLEGKYQPLTLDEAIEACAHIYERLEKAHIPIIRMGLQPTENMQLDRDIAAGPFHPSFKQLVQSEVVYKKVEAILRNSQPKDHMTLWVEKRYVSTLVGNHRKNKLRWMKAYPQLKIQVGDHKGLLVVVNEKTYDISL